MATSTNTTIDPGKLAAALREKFGPGLAGKRRCLKALGYDEARIEQMLRPALGMDARGNRLPLARDQEMPNGSPTVSAAHSLRAAIEQALAGYEDLPPGLTKALLEAAEKHAPMDAGDEEPERSIMRNGEIDRGAEAEELRRRERHGGSGGAEALDAGELARVLREHGVNADEESVKRAFDDMPMNALGGSLGGRFAMKRAGAMDERLDRKFGLGRIEAWGAADHAIDRAPVLSRTGMDKLSKKFPGIESVIV